MWSCVNARNSSASSALRSAGLPARNIMDFRCCKGKTNATALLSDPAACIGQLASSTEVTGGAGIDQTQSVRSLDQPGAARSGDRRNGKIAWIVVGHVHGGVPLHPDLSRHQSHAGRVEIDDRVAVHPEILAREIRNAVPGCLGLVAGVSVSADGHPGASSLFVIRILEELE